MKQKRHKAEPMMRRMAMTLLIALLPAMTAWAGETATLTSDGNGGYYVCMPKTGTSTLTLGDASITTFKVYDDGGKDNNSSKGSDGTLTIVAPENRLVRLTGTVTTSYPVRDYLQVFDGAGTSRQIGKGNYGYFDDVATLTSSGQSMTLKYVSYDEDCAGLDLTVTLIDANIDFSIAIDNQAGGTITTDKTTAKAGTTVSLTVTPDTGSFLDAISVTNANGIAVACSGGLWYQEGNTATFTMPANDVTVVPTFTDALPSINMPATGSTTVSIPSGIQSFKIYDDGGSNGNYSNYCDGYLTMNAPEGSTIRLTGKLTTEASYDKLTVYDGGTTGSTVLLDKKSGKGLDIGKIVCSANVMMLYFHSDYGTNYAGLDLTATLINADTEYDITVKSATGGSTASDKTKAKASETVTLTASPDSGYKTERIDVTDDDGDAVAVTGGTWYTSNTATFTMPAGDVTVSPVFTSATSVQEGLYIDMPKTGTLNATIPAGITTFKVYDDGGKDANYSEYCSGTLVMTAPDGYIFKLEGTLTTAMTDYLSVYDGQSADADTLVYKLHSASAGYAATLEPVYSTDKTLSLYYYSRNNSYAGLDLTVTLVNADTAYDISIASAEGGTVACGKEKAKTGETVTLTATPASGYRLDHLSITDSSGETVRHTDGTWYTSNTATFTMPDGSVTVTPVFTNATTAEAGLCANLPQTGTIRVTVPDGVTSVKLYDDGGKDGDYSNSSDGRLVMTAPEGHVLKVSGSITLADSDWLLVYDGEDTSANPIFSASTTWVGSIITTKDIGVWNSTGRVMTIRLKSDNVFSASGLDLTVEAVDASAQYDVTVSAAQNGTVAADVQTAMMGSTVTLTITPDEGYALESLSAVDAYGHTLPISGLENKAEFAPYAPYVYYTDSTASFTMPNAAVIVTPTFIKKADFYVNMPKTGKTELAIPTDVKQLLVFDSGGKDGHYFIDEDGTLLLTAPEGYVLQVRGCTFANTSNYSKDYLAIHDGSTTDATELNRYYLDVATASSIDVTSSTNQLLFHVYADDSGYAEGFEATVTVIPVVTLDESVESGSALASLCSTYSGQTVRVTFSREFTQNVSSTICLPFGFTADDTEQGTFHHFEGVDESWQVHMSQAVNEIEANKSYLFIPAKTGTITFTGTIDNVAASYAPIADSDTEGWKFEGTYEKIVWDDAEKWGEANAVYAFVAKKLSETSTANPGDFVKLNVGASYTKPFRAVMKYSGSAASRGLLSTERSIPSKLIVVIDSDNGITTQVATIGVEHDSGEWYSLDGRRLNDRPTQEGIYICNGRKVIVKSTSSRHNASRH